VAGSRAAEKNISRCWLSCPREPQVTALLRLQNIPANKPVTASISLARPGKFSQIDGSEPVEMKGYGIMETEGYATSVYYWDESQNKFTIIASGGM